MSIGEVLRRTREDKGLTLADVEEETKIRRRYIRALEEDDFDVLPGKVYVKGFLRNYARFLGLDGQALVEEYENMFPRRSDADPVAESRPPAADFSRPGRSRRGLWVITAVLLVGALFYWWGTAGSVRQNDLSDSGREHNPPAEENRNPGGGNAGGKDTDSKPGPVQRGINVVLEVNDMDCWMRVVVDNQNTFEGLVRPGNTKEFSGQDRIRLKLGNAGAVRVLVNGNDYGFLGEKNTVVEKTFEADEGGHNVGG